MSDYEVVCRFLSNTYEQVNGYDFYRDIFPNCENKGELNTNFSKPNAIFLYQNEDEKLKRRVMLNDTFEDDYMDYIECNPMTLCSGLCYRGRTNKLENAQQMNALIFDLDGVGEKELDNIMYLITMPSNQIRSIPVPTYIVASGTGLHLYYVFKEPIDLYPNIKIQLKNLKYDLTFRFWNPKVTSKEKQIQYQSINQGFRMVGSINEKYGNIVTAFKTGNRITLEAVNAYAQPKNRVDINRRFRPSKITKDEAKELYPEWYKRVVVEGNKRAKKWDIKSKQGYALYNWWRTHAPKIKGGHRYFYLMCLSIYACKCDVKLKKLKEDMLEDFEIVSKSEHSNPLMLEDMNSALEMYSREYYNFRIDDIEKLTDIRIKRNKRNYQKQKWHLEDIRSKKENMKKRRQPFKNSEGRPTKKELVKEWQKSNPDGKKIECAKETKIDPKTIRKWWIK